MFVSIAYGVRCPSWHPSWQRFIEARGGKHLRFKKGYKNVIDKAIELNDEVQVVLLRVRLHAL